MESNHRRRWASTNRSTPELPIRLCDVWHRCRESNPICEVLETCDVTRTLTDMKIGDAWLDLNQRPKGYEPFALPD